MRVLIGCEFSGAVRRAFAALGHDAWSCDLLPAEDGSNRHFVGDVRDYLHMDWDLLAVFHPPCTRLCNSGVRWLSEPPVNAPRDATAAEQMAWPALPVEVKRQIMWRLLDEGAAFFSDLWGAPVERIAVENPIMHRHARERIRDFRPPAQTVQPWWFGDRAFKGTGLYLRNLPPLKPTNKLTPPAPGTDEHKAWSAVHRHSGWGKVGAARWAARSRTFQGIADAMAQQWGDLDGMTPTQRDLFDLQREAA